MLDDVYFYQCDISDREAVFKLAETVKKEVSLLPSSTFQELELKCVRSGRRTHHPHQQCRRGARRISLEHLRADDQKVRFILPPPPLVLCVLPCARTFEVNAMGPFWTTQAFLPDMLKAPSAHIVSTQDYSCWRKITTECKFKVTVASALSYTGIANLAAYTASKAAHLSFHEALTTELAQA